MRLHIAKQVVMLNRNAQLFGHHINSTSNTSEPIAAIQQHPQNPNIWGLKNLSNDIWQMTSIDGTVKPVEPQRSVALVKGVKVDFGTAEGIFVG